MHGFVGVVDSDDNPNAKLALVGDQAMSFLDKNSF
jgi:hypothetical protein